MLLHDKVNVVPVFGILVMLLFLFLLNLVACIAIGDLVLILVVVVVGNSHRFFVGGRLNLPKINKIRWHGPMVW